MQKSQKDIDKDFMNLAIKQAEEALNKGEIPVGAILVYNNEIVAKAQNQVELLRDATAHAELILVSSASEYSQTKYLNGCTLYVTLEPCAMCAGAIGWGQVSRLVFAASDPMKGYRTTAPNVLHPKCEVVHSVLEEESKQLLHDFFISRRKE